MSRTGLIAPMRIEARCLGALAESDALRLRISGVGAAAARRAALELAECGVGGLVSWGLAAGLDPGLRAGDLVVADWVVDGTERLQCTPDWSERLRAVLVRADASLRHHPGGVLQLESPLLEVADKRAAAAGGVLAADMESGAVARVARERGLKFLVVRAVVDGAADRVPAAALAGLDGGRVGAGRVFRALLTSPRNWPSDGPAMLRLSANAVRARRTLRRVARAGGLELTAN